MQAQRLRLGLGIVGLVTVAAILVSWPALAHEGHGKAASQAFDINAPRDVSAETAALIGLETHEVDFGPVESVLRITGIVRPKPDRVQVVSTRIAGSIEAIHVQVGDRVKRGDPVVDIVAPRYLDLLAQIVRAGGEIELLQVEIEAARAQSANADLALQRVEANTDAVAANVASERKRTAIAARAEVLQKQVESSRAQAELAALSSLVDVLRSTALEDSTRPGLLRLVAAMDGVVIARNAIVGQGIEEGKTILEIADYSVVQIEGELPESLVPRLEGASGNAVRIRANAEGEPIATGTIRFISPVVNELKRTAHVLIDADNADGRLRDGMYIDASIVLRTEKDAVVIPASAVLKDGPVVFVFLKDGKAFRKQDIQPGIWTDSVVEILGGLAPGDVIVSRGAYAMSQVRPKVQPAAEPGKDAATPAEVHANEPDGHTDGH